MKPNPTTNDPFERFQANFNQILNLDHELCQLANAITWDRLDAAFADCYSEDMGPPGTLFVNRPTQKVRLYPPEKLFFRFSPHLNRDLRKVHPCFLIAVGQNVGLLLFQGLRSSQDDRSMPSKWLMPLLVMLNEA